LVLRLRLVWLLQLRMLLLLRLMLQMLLLLLLLLLLGVGNPMGRLERRRPCRPPCLHPGPQSRVRGCRVWRVGGIGRRMRRWGWSRRVDRSLGSLGWMAPDVGG
jgi:hypothetical protein